MGEAQTCLWPRHTCQGRGEGQHSEEGRGKLAGPGCSAVAWGWPMVLGPGIELLSPGHPERRAGPAWERADPEVHPEVQPLVNAGCSGAFPHTDSTSGCDLMRSFPLKIRFSSLLRGTLSNLKTPRSAGPFPLQTRAGPSGPGWWRRRVQEGVEPAPSRSAGALTPLCSRRVSRVRMLPCPLQGLIQAPVVPSHLIWSFTL